jgi:uncharacterized membrane protein
MIRRLQNAFFTGLFLLLPMAVAWWVGGWLLNLFSGWEVELIHNWTSLPEKLPFYWTALLQAVAFLLTCLLIIGVGMLARSFIGRRLFEWLDQGMERLPVLGAIYDATRQLLNAFKGGASKFQDVVLVAYPHAGSKSVGFVSNRIPAGDGQPERVAVFVPTSPNPTAGFIMLFPVDAVEFLEMSTEDGFKFILSGGIALDVAHLRRRSPNPVTGENQ